MILLIVVAMVIGQVRVSLLMIAAIKSKWVCGGIRLFDIGQCWRKREKVISGLNGSQLKKGVFLWSHCHEIHRVEEVGLKSFFFISQKHSEIPTFWNFSSEIFNFHLYFTENRLCWAPPWRQRGMLVLILVRMERGDPQWYHLDVSGGFFFKFTRDVNHPPW